MVSRQRSRAGIRTRAGTYKVWYMGYPFEASKDAYTSEVCDDTVGQRETANLFDLVVRWCDIPGLSGSWGSPPYVNTLTNWPIDFTPVPPISVYLAPTELELSNAAWTITARTNPSRPHVSVPTFVGELRELPSSVRDWGGSLLKKVAKGHLTWRWAVKPMVGDVRKMANFVEAVDDRIRWLTRLQNEGYLSQRCGLGRTETSTTSGELTLHSSNVLVKGKRTLNHSKKEWGSAQWKLNPGVSLPKTAQGLRKLAFSLTFGINSYAALETAWELLPWSWFVDWFAGVGDVISSFNNSIPLTVSKICLMRTLNSYSKYTITQKPSYISIDGAYGEGEIRKLRYPNLATTYPLELTSLPLVDRGKWSILGSLAILKMSPRR